MCTLSGDTPKVSLTFPTATLEGSPSFTAMYAASFAASPRGKTAPEMPPFSGISTRYAGAPLVALIHGHAPYGNLFGAEPQQGVSQESSHGLCLPTRPH